MNLDQARRIAQRHEDTYNNDFECYGDLYTDDCVIYRPVQGATHDKQTMLALERRATAACPDRKTSVLRVFAGDGDWLSYEELWEGTNTGGDAMFGPVGTRVSVYALSLCEVRDGRFARCRQILPAEERFGLEGKLLLAEALVAEVTEGPDAGVPAFELAVEIFRRYSTPWLEARALEDWAHVQGHARRRSRAASLRRQAETLYRRVEAGQPWLDRLAAMSRPSGTSADRSDLPDGLTSWEAEVLRLVALGCTSKEIGEELVLSVRTVERHIANIYLKTGTHSRVTATTYAAAHGLLEPGSSR